MSFYEGDAWVETPSYRDIVNDFGYEVLLEVKDDDYQGDSRFLLRDGDRYGWLQFGWGSCSGCDALEACDSIADLEKLKAELRGQVKWFASKSEASKFFDEHDWEADYSWSEDNQKAFVAKAKEALS